MAVHVDDLVSPRGTPDCTSVRFTIAGKRAPPVGRMGGRDALVREEQVSLVDQAHPAPATPHKQQPLIVVFYFFFDEFVCNEHQVLRQHKSTICSSQQANNVTEHAFSEKITILFQRVTQIINRFGLAVVMVTADALYLAIFRYNSRRTAFLLGSSVDTLPVTELVAAPVQRVLVTFVQQQRFALAAAHKLGAVAIAI